MTVIRVLDFETTGLPPSADVIEIGYTDVTLLQGNGILFPTQSYLCRPDLPISLEAMAVHHITQQEIDDVELHHTQALKELADAPMTIWCAHNADFEKKFFNPEGFLWIDTYKVGRVLWFDCPSHSNQVLRYYLNLAIGDPLTQPAHRAGPDTYVSALILCEALKLASVMDLVEISDKPLRPKLLVTCYFKKHRNTLWKDVPKDYLRWLAGQDWLEPDQRFTVEYYLKPVAI